jgi:Glycosyl hydrolases family 25
VTEYLIDAASYQGQINWAAVDTACAGGWEKVTQGIGYTNPYWASARGAMAARRAASGFVPGGYLFLEEGPSGGAQADYFHAEAGDLTGFGIAVDAEPLAGLRRLAASYPEIHAAASALAPGEGLRQLAQVTQIDFGRVASSLPSLATLRACVARLRVLYPGHRIGGYLPAWYWGTLDNSMVDWLWASNYVLGSGSPAALFARVQPYQWAAYGGHAPAVLQFTSQAAVPGVGGVCDCSAFRGTAAELASLILGGAAPAPPPPPGRDDDMRGTLNCGPRAVTMIKFPGGTGHQIEFLSDFTLTGSPAPTLRVAVHDPAHGWHQTEHVTLDAGMVTRVPFAAGSTPNGISVQRDGQGDEVEVGWDIV